MNNEMVVALRGCLEKMKKYSEKYDGVVTLSLSNGDGYSVSISVGKTEEMERREEYENISLR